MSRHFKRPKPILNMGNTRARLIKNARAIKTQEELDRCLAQVSPMIGQAWLELAKPFLNFTPRQFEAVSIPSE